MAFSPGCAVNSRSSVSCDEIVSPAREGVCQGIGCVSDRTAMH